MSSEMLRIDMFKPLCSHKAPILHSNKVFFHDTKAFFLNNRSFAFCCDNNARLHNSLS